VVLLLTEPEACVDAIIERVGKDLRVATPLAAGKPNHLLNALYARAKGDPAIHLTIYTALTLQRPRGKSDLERRFLGPFVERVFGNYPDLEYEADRVAGCVPDNIRIIEFYFAPAKYIGNAPVQRDYISSNYTHAARDVIDRGVNVLVQQVARGEVDGEDRLSLSCNPDLTVDLMHAMREQREQNEPVVFVAQTNDELPFMFGDANLPRDAFDIVVENPELDYRVFGPPKMSVTDTEFAIGLHVSRLIKDGGELQVGIGSLGDAIVHALLLRHEKNDEYLEILDGFEVDARHDERVLSLGGDGPFEEGLFAASEMLVDGFMHLLQRGIIKRRVHDDLHLQRLLNRGLITEEVTSGTLEALLRAGAIHSKLSEDDVTYLRHFGVFKREVVSNDGKLRVGDGPPIEPDLLNPAERARIDDECLGESLRHAAVMHGGFFLGNQALYETLREMPEEQRRLIRMRSVTRINQLYGHEEIDRLHRRDARFVNTCMMVTLSGAAVSDALADGTIISGVGGQYNFVDMAQALPDGHSILNVRATRMSKGKVRSNIVWNYGHVTIPRHLRDIYVTEYGVARVRGSTDEEIIQALLNIADSRFQSDLMLKAKEAGKLARDYEIPKQFTNNYPDAIQKRIGKFKERGLFPPFPLGCDFTEVELKVGKALKRLKAAQDEPLGMPRLILAALARGKVTPEMEPCLERMQLAKPKDAKEKLYRRLLAYALEG